MVKRGAILFLFFLAIHASAQKELVLTWEIQHPISHQWFPLGERGSVQEALLHLGMLPDPLYGENEKLYQWIEGHQWHIRSRFFITEDLFNAAQVEVQFPCIDTYASVYLNQQKILEAQNYFHPYQVDVRDKLKVGFNEIEAIFTPPALFHQSRYESEPFHYPAPNDNAKVKAAPLTRKPQYQFGWDWSPRINTLGFPYPVSIKGKSPECLNSCVVNTLNIGDTAELEWVLIKNPQVKAHSIRSQVFRWEVKNDGKNVQKFRFSLNNPQLWYPREFGVPNMYMDTLILLDEQGNILQKYGYFFGIRSVRLVQQADAWGTSFFFEINGKPVFIKGANLIPPSIYGGATSAKEWESWVALMENSHFNMVRIWGGGDYADEAFLNACDKAGIMVWHDAMFACAMYPGSPEFLANVEEEFHYQWPRISRHPSVVYVNGNNEVDVAWKNWGLQQEYALDTNDQKVIEQAYDALFNQLLPSVLRQYSNLPYVHTSPLSNWGKPEGFNHGTQHYWGVWHGNDPIHDFAHKIGRFNAEYGFQSFPEYSTLAGFCDASNWSIESNAMKHHQKSYVGNAKILSIAFDLLGSHKDFKELVYFSQLTQAHAMSTAIGAHLLDAPRCMGTLYWQLNDCWPAPTWSSIDFYGNWKAMHYKVRALYQPISLVQRAEKQQLSLVANNIDSVQTVAHIEVYSLKGRKPRTLTYDSKNISLKNFESLTIFDGKAMKIPYAVKVVVGQEKERIFVFGGLPEVKKPKANLSIISMDGSRKTGVLKFENQHFMADVWFYSMTPGVVFEHNFEHFLPGEHEISFTFDETPTQFNYCYR
jgi:beta-mannosidase